MYYQPFRYPIKGKGWYPSRETFRALKHTRTHSQVLKPPAPSEQSGLEHAPHVHQRLGAPIPLSTVCNPYCKLNIALVAHATSIHLCALQAHHPNINAQSTNLQVGSLEHRHLAW
jgi:hypothetical protein